MGQCDSIGSNEFNNQYYILWGQINVLWTYVINTLLLHKAHHNHFYIEQMQSPYLKIFCAHSICMAQTLDLTSNNSSVKSNAKI
jgi:hypothetical protein